MKDNEQWKDIPGYEGLYKASNLGGVVSIRTGKQIYKDTIAGYKQVALYNKGTCRRYRVHRLVLLVFVGDSTLQVNHINGVKSDNKLSNLEYVTQSQNMKHAYKKGLQTPIDNGLSKKISVSKDGVLIETFPSIRELCRKMDLDRSTVGKVLRGKIKHYKGYTFKLEL
jgi:hypothetical protein